MTEMRCFEGRAGPRGGGGSSWFSWENDKAPLSFCIRTSTRNWWCFDKIPWGLKYKMLLPLECAPLNQVTFEDGEVGVIWKGKNCDKTAFSWELYCPGSVPMEAIQLLLCPSRGVPVGEDTVVPEEVQQPPLGWALINLRIKLHKYNTTCVAWSLSNEKKISKPLLDPYASTSILYTKMSEWTIATKNRQRQDLTIIFLN